MATSYELTGYVNATMPIADVPTFVGAVEQALTAAGIDVTTVRFTLQAQSSSGASGASGPFPPTGASGATGAVPA